MVDINRESELPKQNLKPVQVPVPTVDKNQNVKVAKGFKVPPVIEPPIMNPRTGKLVNGVGNPASKRVLKKSAKFAGLEALGGIFAINNGWEKTAEQTKNFTIPKIKKSITAGTSNKQDSHGFNFKDAEKPKVPSKPNELRQQILYNTKKIAFVPEKKTAPTDKFNFRNKESGSESSDESSDDNKAGSGSDTNRKRKSMFSESEDDEEETSPVAKDSAEDESLENSSKRQKTSDDESVTNDGGSHEAGDDDEDAIELLYNDDDLDLLDADYEPPTSKKAANPPTGRGREAVIPEPSYTTDLDDLKVTFRKEVPVDPVTATKEEFDRNTEAISTKIRKDDVTHRVFRRFFSDACSDFLNDNCLVPCERMHSVPEVKAVRIVFERAQVKDIEEAYGVCINYPKLFESFFPLFAEMFIKKMPDCEPRMAQMVMDCERTARTHSKYKEVVHALVAHKPMNLCDAIKFVIKHHVDSAHGQDVIMQMIAETGPDLVQFIGYFNEIFRLRSVPLPVLDRILSVCVKYQEPDLPKFILNNLIHKKRDDLQKLNTEGNVAKFIQLQHHLTEDDNTAREEKCLTLILNMKGQNLRAP